jgi:gluconate kinase
VGRPKNGGAGWFQNCVKIAEKLDHDESEPYQIRVKSGKKKYERETKRSGASNRRFIYLRGVKCAATNT